jgi:hypothetical protein
MCGASACPPHRSTTPERLRLQQNLLIEIGQLENLHPTERVHLQQVNITRDKNIGFCRNGQLQKFIVLWVSAFCDRCGGLDQNRRFSEEPHPHQAMLKGPPLTALNFSRARTVASSLKVSAEQKTSCSRTARRKIFAGSRSGYKQAGMSELVSKSTLLRT